MRGFRIKRSHDFEHTRAICYFTYVMQSSEQGRLSMAAFYKNFFPLMTDIQEPETSKEDIQKRFDFIRERYKIQNEVNG